MPVIQIVLEEDLLQKTDDAAHRVRQNRSALIRDAIREHLRRLNTLELERKLLEAYKRIPDNEPELDDWERVAAWPEE